MAKLNMVLQHRLPQDEAVRRVKGLLSEVQSDYSDQISNLNQIWTGPCANFSFNAIGCCINGNLEVKQSSVDLCCNLPFAAMLVKGKIEAAIRAKAETLLRG